MQIEIEGISIELQKKNIKNLHVAVYPPDGRVRVSVPKRLSDESVKAFILSRIPWIQKQRERLKSLPPAPACEYTSGETLWVWGERYTLRLACAKKSSLVLSGEEAVLSLKEGSTKEEREAVVNEYYRAILKEKLALYLPKWEMQTGLHPDSVHTKNMTTRWGTCNPKAKRIWFSLKLAQKPVSCLEYVILHELAHLKVRNHGQDFVSIMNTYMPDWPSIKARLNQ